MIDLQTTLAQHLAAPDTGWSMGSFGAIAEFHQDQGEEARDMALGRVTARGGLRLDAVRDVTPIAYETTMKHPARWGHGVALCRSLDAAQMSRRTVLTELGPDTDALRTEDRDAILFDMGLDQHQVDFCIRTRDPELLAILRASAGRALTEPDNPAMGAILHAHPHRVALSRLGRVEVYQMIGGPDTGGVSPPGPHTHVLPKLLRAGRTHSANISLPEGMVPCAFFYPANPLLTPLGEERPYDPVAAQAFDALVAQLATPAHRNTKAQTLAALAAGRAPDSLSPETRAERKALRVTLRQARARGDSFSLLDAWIAHHDTPHAAETDEADDTPERQGH